MRLFFACADGCAADAGDLTLLFVLRVVLSRCACAAIVGRLARQRVAVQPVEPRLAGSAPPAEVVVGGGAGVEPAVPEGH